MPPNILLSLFIFLIKTSTFFIWFMISVHYFLHFDAFCCLFSVSCLSQHHRLRGSASPVLTATHHSYGSPRLSALFFPLGSGGQTPQRTFTQNGSNDVFSRKDVPFAAKLATFHTP